MKQKWTIYLTTISMAEILHGYSTFHSLDVLSSCFACYLSLLLLLSQIPRVPYWAAKRTIVSWPWINIRCPQSRSCFLPSAEQREENKIKNPLWMKKKKFNKAEACMEAKKMQWLILLFPSTGDVHLLPRKQGFNICSGCPWRQTETL